MALGRRQLVSLLTLLLCVGFLATSMVNYFVARDLIRHSIVDSELPLTSDNIYSEIQRDLVRPIFVSSMMAGDTFLRDWVIAGEMDVSRVSRYLAEVRQRYGAHTSFFVSESSRKYYQADGVLKQIKENEPRDAWYYRVRNIKAPYEINVDLDMAHKDQLTIFVNYRVFDYANQFIGVTGVGLAVDSVRDLVNSYQDKFQRTIYFVDENGKIALFANNSREAQKKSILETDGLRDIAPQILSGKGGTYEYRNAGNNHLLNVRYIPELHWYLFVEKHEEEALSVIRRTLYLSLAISAGITLLVLLLVNLAIGRYQTRLESMAMTDKLTGLANRQALDMILKRDIAEHRRNKFGMVAIMLDLDHFKTINDRYGHLAGDAVIRGVAEVVRTQLRDTDLICRWGGEEFLVILKRTELNSAIIVADKIRRAVEAIVVPFGEERFKVTVSLGIAVLRNDDSQDSLLARADKALYIAKEDGRNLVRVEED